MTLVTPAEFPSSSGLPSDGANIFSPQAQLIGRVKLPERCDNLCFGGQKRNRWFMAAAHSLYSVYVNTQGALGG